MKTIKDYVIIIAAIIIMVLTLRLGCSNPFPNLDVTPQTIYKSDTIFSKDTLVEFKTIIKPRHDTVYQIDTIVEQARLDSVPFMRVYNDSLVDSTLTIFTKAKTFGYLDELKIAYKLKPKPVLITNTITITNVKIQPSKVSIITGLELGGNKSSFNLSPYLKVDIKNVSIGYRFGVIDNTHSIGVGYKIFNSKK